MSEQYDNTNRGSLWPVKGFGGRLDIEGVEHYVQIVATGSKSDNAPAYNAVIRGKDTDIFPIFRKEGKNNLVGSGRYKDHWINVFVNEAKSDKSPVLRLWATPVEDNRASVPAKETIYRDDDLPF